MRITLYYPEANRNKASIDPHALRYAAGFEAEPGNHHPFNADADLRGCLQDYVDARGLAVGKYIVQVAVTDKSSKLYLFEVASANPPLQVL